MMDFPDKFFSRTQDLNDCYFDAAQFYWGKKNTWLKNDKIFVHDSVPIVISKEDFVDIDNIDDWTKAENLMKKNIGNIF